MTNLEKIVIFWFRRDLRLFDNNGLFNALNSGFKVLPVFIFDKNILEKLPRDDKRVSFIASALRGMYENLLPKGKSIQLFYGDPKQIFKNLIKTHNIHAVYINADYEPYALKRDLEVEDLLNSENIPLFKYKDQVIFEKDEILKSDQTPYTVYTPYSKVWKVRLNLPLPNYNSENYLKNLINKDAVDPILFLKQMGFNYHVEVSSSYTLNEKELLTYEKQRDIPAQNATSHISVHLRFGTVSIRQVVEKAVVLNSTWLNELIWREFFMQILFHFPHSAIGAFKTKYNFIAWRNNEADFKLWCDGKTGYPLVDAGMRELNSTGFMHNRVRMVVASFLTKHLLINWQWGEAYFAEKLLDFDLSANIGNWQWAAGSGCDAAPYFRVFNPSTQAKKFDSNNEYIKKWVPEYGTILYPEPMVEHKFARNRCLIAYKSVL